MQQVTGRLTRNAEIKTLENGKEYLQFTIVDNGSYKPKNSDERQEVATFFNCAYFIGTGVSKVLRKGAVVQVGGRLSARPYQSNTGDWTASLSLIANRIDVLTYAPKEAQQDTKEQPSAKKNNGKKAGQKKQQDGETDDLPF